MSSPRARRLLAVMFTDVVGYTALMQRDEEAAKIVRRRHRQVLEAALGVGRGELLQYLGDGSLSTFPSVADAVRAAIQVQRELGIEPPIPLRIGIHQGDISYDTQGAYGDSVNIAARIQSLGAPGSILLSAKARDEIKNQADISTTGLGVFELKNVTEPVEVHAVVSDTLVVPTRSDVLEKVRSTPGEAAEVVVRLNTALTGRYRIERELGEGGMAKVYLADDLKHERKVALKVLKPALAAAVGADRFLAEIKTTANLQHPHILPLFDSGEADGFLFHVMPYVEGESLRDRLDRETQLPVDEAVRIATDIAEALDYAHRQGVIHRDIKPANILLSGGRPLISDFGIALAVSTAGADRLTETGMTLGTPYYMSPEQATADLDPGARSDIYSLGCVLFEMLVGEPPYTGSTAQAILGKIVAGPTPKVTAVRPTVPHHVEDAILQALERVPADRQSTARQFAETLAQGAGPAAGRAASSVSARGLSPVLAAAVAVVTLAGGFALGRTGGQGVANAGLTRLSITLPDSAPMAFVGDATLGIGRKALAVSNDRATLAYVGVREDVARLYVRHFDDFIARELVGTEGAFSPFFSPDGLWIGYFVGNQLLKVPTDGGDPVPLAEVPNPMGGDWSPSGTLIAAAGEGQVLFRLSDEGGELRSVGIAGWNHAYPQFLPGGESVLLSGGTQGGGILDLQAGTVRGVGAEGFELAYVDPGYLIYVLGSTLHAARFDWEAGAITSPFVPVLTGLRAEAFGQGQWDVSSDGTLVYAPGGSTAFPPVAWAWPDGRLQQLELPARVRGTFELSPDGSRLAISEIGSGQDHIWLYDLDSGRPLQLTVETGNYGPVSWSPDGSEVFYNRDQAILDSRAARVRRSDGGGSARTLLPELGDAVWAMGWSPSGLISVRLFPELDVVDPATGEVTVIPTPDASGWGLVISSNADVVAYTSAHTGEFHVYVQPFPPTGEVQQVSLSGGAEEPLWSRDGRNLYYRHGRRIMVAPVTTTPALQVGAREVFIDGNFVNVLERSYDIVADQSRALVIDGGVETTHTLHVVHGWLDRVELLIREAEDGGSGR